MVSEINKIFNHLMDDESRWPFDLRLKLSIDKDVYAFSNEICRHYKDWKMENNLINHIDNGVVIFGYGHYGKKIGQLLPLLGLDVKCFCDNNAIQINGENVFTPKEAINRYPESLFVISSPRYMNQMYSNLIELGLDAKQIMISEFGIPFASRGNQYFDFFAACENECFVDCGGYIGDTLDSFKAWTNNSFNKAYSLEPIKSNYVRLNDKYMRDDRVKVLNNAAWDKKEVLCFSESGPGSRASEAGEIFVEGVNLDSILSNERVTYIKMDIEGSEEKALLGCKRTIISQKPKLAICVYHKPEDVVQLANIILELNPDYNLGLRHYCSNEWETVLYAF